MSGTEETEGRTEWIVAAGAASIAAAVLHGAAAGTHAEHTDLARIFVAVAVLQGLVGVLALVRRDRAAALIVGLVSAAALVGWIVTLTVDLPSIGGLETASSPGLADTVAAVLAGLALTAAALGALLGRGVGGPVTRGALPSALALSAGVLLVPGLVGAIDHDHDDHDDATEGHDQDEGEDVIASGAGEGAAGVTGDDHDEATHDDHETSATDDHDDHETTEGQATSWPRPWDPTAPVDFSGVDGVTDEQTSRAEQLVDLTMRELPAFADTATAESLGYHSIGDASTGFEHYINVALITDDKFLDPTAPESLVYRVDGDARTLVSAMFIADARPLDDPSLTEYAGPLMQWHVHDNLCWGLDDGGEPVVRGVLEDVGGSCPDGTVNAGGKFPMVHVWIAPHECGPFAALEGQGAGQTAVGDGARMDQCAHDHGDDGGADDDHDGHDGETATQPYDPELPIDLGGVDGVTPRQQAFAENLVAATVRDLPQWADLDAVEAAGFHSIGDGATGHEHYIQWDWVDDDVVLDPDAPESLVFEIQPDGSKKLVSAMYMLPSGTQLDEVPDWGGALMQWHVHGNLCFTDDPVAPKVATVKPLGTTCPEPYVDGTMAPMIHVWITPHECGPFAALEGIAGGQVPEGEDTLCDHAHGS